MRVPNASYRPDAVEWCPIRTNPSSSPTPIRPSFRLDADSDRALEELVRDADPELFSGTSADDIVGFREV